MAYFTGYFTDYFDVEGGVVVEEAVVRSGGGLAPSMAEWKEYLRRWHERRRIEAAEKAARAGIREALQEIIYPPKTVAEAVEIAVAKVEIEERAETRFRLLHEDNTEYELEIARIRLEMAKIVRDVRARAASIKKEQIKKRKRRRDEEALLLLI